VRCFQASWAKDTCVHSCILRSRHRDDLHRQGSVALYGIRTPVPASNRHHCRGNTRLLMIHYRLWTLALRIPRVHFRMQIRNAVSESAEQRQIGPPESYLPPYWYSATKCGPARLGIRPSGSEAGDLLSPVSYAWLRLRHESCCYKPMSSTLVILS